MPSSTSNSSSRLSGNLALRSWILGLLVVISCELVLRGLGYHSGLHDSMAFWSEQRERVTQSGGNAVVLLGASRMQRGIVPEALAPFFPGKPIVMLAVDGRPPMASLADLAEDPLFHGTVICDLDVHRMLMNSWNLHAQSPYVDYYRNQWSLFDWIKLQGILAVQQRVVLFHSRFSIRSLVSPYQENRFRAHLVLRRDRFEEAHYRWMTPPLRETAIELAYSHYKSFYENEPLPSPEEMDKPFKYTEAILEKLRAKGCRVILLRLPTSGKVWALDQQFFPKEKYWDRFARQTQAETVHFMDFPSLRHFECPEGSHLEYQDAIAFTKALGTLLENPYLYRTVSEKRP